MDKRSSGKACVVFKDDNSTIDVDATSRRLSAIQEDRPVDAFVNGRRVYCVGERPNERVLIDPIYGEELTDSGKGKFQIPWGEVTEEGRRFVIYLIKVAEAIDVSRLVRADVVTIWTQVKEGLEPLSLLYGGEEELVNFRDALADGSAPQVFSTRVRVKAGNDGSRSGQRSRNLERAVTGT